jgi:hypothetical protein
MNWIALVTESGQFLIQCRLALLESLMVNRPFQIPAVVKSQRNTGFRPSLNNRPTLTNEEVCLAV